MSDLAAIAERIHTGLDNPENSRALVVFNPTDQILRGVAVFRAAMSWPRDRPLPPVLVTAVDGNAVPAAIKDLAQAPDAKGRADRQQLTFSLCFAVSDVPANGWRTYIASYADNASPPLSNRLPTPGLAVIETTRHGGDLPPVGNLVGTERSQVE